MGQTVSKQLGAYEIFAKTPTFEKSGGDPEADKDQ